ncbi:MAG: exodeoxyribonuclease VII large subunit [Prosthecochloris sp.]|uniref:exodeoxyribonuclease VII large subunit n=1 Tax=Prosthecochloris sp. TaxID=290513 RepID=UPI0013CC2A13|nr:exodeoxyribonuclease VII large subunit [Prosthecochloris sp.]NEX11482.1 exodeoxyribonuclease VII large subunit [Prosthecochloris sp.]
MQQILSVSELTLNIKNRLESAFPTVTVRGEISNFRLPASGHIYMTLKDEDAQIPAVIWKNVRLRLPAELRDGMEIIAAGRLEVYPPSGRYQLICSSLTLAGEGMLQQAFAMLLQKLAAAGYFNVEHKKPLPAYPETIALVTSPTGAVIKDMGDVLSRRFPAASLLLYPVKVQGEGAVNNIIDALEYFNTTTVDQHRPDLIIVARGGGSLEDLQAFNEERVAMAIFHSSIPVISAVGHETDFTIADMVADVRAGTPSIAAEIAVPDKEELLQKINTLAQRQLSSLNTRIDGAEREIDSLTGSYAFNRPKVLCKQLDAEITTIIGFMSRSLKGRIEHIEQRFSAAEGRLSLLDYRNVLRRGFALIKTESGYITTSRDMARKKRASAVFYDGEIPIMTDGSDKGDEQVQDPHEY